MRFPHATIVEHVEDQAFWNRIDCVVCCSWPGAHEKALGLAIDYAKPCFCEKPAASNTAALDEIIQRLSSQQLVIRVGHTFRYMGGAARFINLAQEENLSYAEITYLGSGPRGSRWQMDSRKSFSLTHLTHAIDFVITTAGNILNVESAVWAKTDDTDTLAAAFKTERCPLVSLLATNAASAFTLKATAILHDGALLHLDSLRNVTLTGKNPSEKRSGLIWKERDLGTLCQNDGYMDEIRDFFAEIRGEGQCRLPNLIQARHVLSVIEELEGRD